MTRSLLLLIVALAASGYPAPGQTPSERELLQRGAERYENGEFTAALEVYEEVLADYGASGPLLYNMGNAYFRSDRLGQAIRYYEKAAEHMPSHRMIEHNLEVARSRIEQPVPTIPAPFWQRWWNLLMRILGPSGLVVIGLGAYLPVVGVLGYRIWKGRPTDTFTLPMGVLAAVAVAGIGGGLLGSWFESSDRRAVVISSETNLYYDPATSSTIARDVPEGTTLSVREDLSEWQHVRLPNGATGWIEKKDTGDI